VKKIDAIEITMEVLTLMHQIHALLHQNMIKSFKKLSITPPQGMVIRNLGKNGRMKISEISKTLGLSNSTVSGIIDRLENQNIVDRERSKEDKRVVYVSLTSEFEKIYEDIHKKSEETIKSILTKGTPEDLDKIIEALNTLKRLLSSNLKIIGDDNK
jgi:MarR family transcriptional regulator, organic hydroperoxide resistance regulator